MRYSSINSYMLGVSLTNFEKKAKEIYRISDTLFNSFTELRENDEDIKAISCLTSITIFKENLYKCNAFHLVHPYNPIVFNLTPKGKYDSFDKVFSYIEHNKIVNLEEKREEFIKYICREHIEFLLLDISGLNSEMKWYESNFYPQLDRGSSKNIFYLRSSVFNNFHRILTEVMPCL